jgi:hypothetical protein
MVILHYRSPYLQRILSTNKKKTDGTLSHIKLPNILPEIFQIILRYEGLLYKMIDVFYYTVFYYIYYYFVFNLGIFMGEDFL